MSSGPAISPLSPADQTEIARALPTGGPAGAAHQAYVIVRGRRIYVNAVRRPAGDDAQAAFSAVATRRAEARADRLLPVLASGCHKDCYWIAYEYGAAKPLVSEGWRKWPAAAALDLLSGIAHAVDEAASNGVLAHELVPASIFIDPRVGPLVGDFGSAREAFGNPPFEEEAAPPFVPPEVASRGQAGARSGVYAAGALFYALLSGGPPRPEAVTHWRNDLPIDINLVLARAMARDSLQRYGTAAEFCESARRALPGQIATARDSERQKLQPQLVQRPRPRPARPRPAIDAGQLARIAPAELEDEEWRPSPPRYLRPLRAGIVIGAVALAAFAGIQMGTQDAPAGSAGSELVGNGASITLPRGWSPGVPPDGVALAAFPSNDWFSGLTVRLSDKGAPAGDRSDPVRLGQLDMWRERSPSSGVVRYTAPTTEGTLVVSCEAASGTPDTLTLCERAISTLRLQSAKPLPLSGVVDEPGVRAAVTRLGRSRRAGRSQLARADRPAEQRAAATALARTYEQGARRLAKVPESGGAATAARRAASAYRRLAATAGTSSRRRWAAAVGSVRRAEAEVAKSLRAI